MTTYRTVESARVEDFTNTIQAATNAGLTLQAEDEGHVLCGSTHSNELVDVYPNGSWEWQNIDEDGKAITMTGTNAALLQMFLASDENKAMFFAHQDGDGGEELKDD